MRSAMRQTTIHRKRKRPRPDPPRRPERPEPVVIEAQAQAEPLPVWWRRIINTVREKMRRGV